MRVRFRLRLSVPKGDGSDFSVFGFRLLLRIGASIITYTVLGFLIIL